MAKVLPTRIVTATLDLGSAGSLTVPFGLPTHAALDTSGRALAEALQNAWQAHWLDQGDLAALARAAAPARVDHDVLDVAVEGPRDGAFPAHTRRFDVLVATVGESHWLGMVPLLGLESLAGTREALFERLGRSVQLEFARTRRLREPAKLAYTSRVQACTVEMHSVMLDVRTPAEVETLRREKSGAELAAAARRMSRPARAPVGLVEAAQRIAAALHGTPPRGVLVVGPAGCGKTAAIERYLRERIGELPYATTAARLVQALTREGAWQGALARLVESLRAAGAVLYVDHLHELFEVGQYEGNALSLGDALREPLERGSLTLLAEADEAALARLEARSGGITALFDIVRIEPPRDADALALVQRAVRADARAASVAIEEGAIELSLSLHRRFFPYAGFPGRVLRFLDSLLVARRERADTSVLDADAVLDAFCAQSGIPRSIVDDARPLDPTAVEDWFRARVMGQDGAVRRTVDVIASLKARVQREERPLANLFFAGPTGVGKTELAKCLALWLFGDASRLVRVDMSEYADPGAVMRLTGDVLGDGASLAARVRQQPFSVVLFDEVEKAHPNFFDLLLQVLGDGRLTDARGDVTSFCSCIVVLTSNVGADGFGRPAPGFAGDRFGEAGAERHFVEAVEAHFRPELFNRLDHVVPFAPLPARVQAGVAARLVDALCKRRGLLERDVTLELGRGVLDHLARAGHDPRYGARGMRRSVEAQLTRPVADALNAAPEHGLSRLVAELTEGDIVVHGVERTARKGPGGPLRDASVLTARRRRMQALAEGPAMAALNNELTRLRLDAETVARAGRAAPPAPRALMLERLDADVKALLGQALEAEDASLVAQLTEEAAPRATFLAPEVAALRIRVADTYRPETRRTALAVYGPAARCSQLVGAYRALAERRGADVSTARVVLDGTAYAKQLLPLDRAAAAYKARHVGEVLLLRGECVLPYFEGETGVHRFESTDASTDNCFVAVTPGALEDLEVPDGVHRQSFFTQHLPRRKYDGAAFDDRAYRERFDSLSGSAFAEYLDARFAQWLETTLERHRSGPSEFAGSDQ